MEVCGRSPTIGLILLLLLPVQAVAAPDTHTGSTVRSENAQRHTDDTSPVLGIAASDATRVYIDREQMITADNLYARGVSIDSGALLAQEFTGPQMAAIRAARSHDLRRAQPTVIVTPALEVWITGCLSGPPIAQGDHQFQRVRSSDVAIVTRIEQATARSPTFKRLVATLERSNGIIYVESGVCRGRVASCLPTWMISSGSQRFLRIIVDRRRLDTAPLLVGAIAHELQHGIEALSDPHVTDSTKMQFFYQRYAPTDKGRFETPEAIHAGIAVEDEWRTWCGAHR